MNTNEMTNSDIRKFTWKEIKQMIESAGVKDEDEIDGIDISWGAYTDFECKKDDILGWQILL